jgi:transcriptional regulator with XRE-family HTH domain
MLERIKERTKAKGWTMSQLCREMGTARSYFTNFKNGNLSITEERLNQIAKLLDCSVEYLKGETDDASKPGVSPNKQKLLDLIDTLSEEQMERFAGLIEAMK